MALLLVASAAGLGGSSAVAAPEILWDRCQSGTEAGQCRLPRGIAADSENGHVFVGDQINRRVVELNALGQFIKAWGWDVVESGPGEDTVAPEDEFEICVPENGDVCKAGESGNGAGQFSAALGLAIDSSGNIFAVDFSNSRVQKFDRNGNFLLQFGSFGTGPGQFSWSAVGDFIAITSSDKVFVGGEERIQRFNTAGVYQDECEVPGAVQSLDTDAAGNLYAIYAGEVHKLAYATPACEDLGISFEIPKLGEAAPTATAGAVDSAGNVYAFGPTNPGQPTDPIFKFDSAGKLIESFGKGEFNASTGLETNLCAESEPPGNFYVSNASEGNAFVRAYGTEPIGCGKARTGKADPITETTATLNGTVNPKGEAVSECFFQFGETTSYGQTADCEDPDATEIGTGSSPVPVHADISGLDPGTVYHFRLLARVGGELETGADEVFKTLGPPLISDAYVLGATEDEATLKALVNPEGFATTCSFEYGPSASYGSSSNTIPIAPSRAIKPVVATIASLEPGTTYHWRVLCANSSDTTASEDHTVTTYRTFAPDTDCPNQALRSGPSAPLPDCRAYEMVSPLDKNGADIVRRGLNSVAEPGDYIQASPDGERLTYTAPASFADQPSSVSFNQYLAAREEGEGWSSQGIRPPVNGEWITIGPAAFNREFIAFSADLCDAWLLDQQSPPLTPDAQDGYYNLFRRDNCEPGAGGLEALTDVEPPEGTPVDYVTRYSVQGTSNDSRHAFFIAKAALSEDAAAGNDDQIYDRFEGELHLVSVLPDGSAATGSSGVGSGGWFGNLEGAVSADGSRVYWTAGVIDRQGAGKIYLRENPEQPQSALDGEDKCTEGLKACTVAVSATNSAFFWAASPNGAKAVFSEGANLYEFDLQAAEGGEVPRLIAPAVRGVAGTSEDLARIYFVSDVALPEAGQNSEGAEAVEGQPNLYLAEGEDFSYIATLTEGDVGLKEPDGVLEAYDVASRLPYLRASRVTPDGSRIAFQSRAPLTGFDNTELASGKPAVEVYAYDAGGELLCISCNPSGARPSGRELREAYARPIDASPTAVIAAAWIPTWEQPLHASRVLSDDGNRLFFHSNDALIPRDGNGAQDLYEWEVPGVGRCTEASTSYFPQNGGCLYLISSGESRYESEFWDASADGDDVFFSTESSLVPSDPGLVDLYDARVGGGLPIPVVKEECEGEACQSPPAPPQFETPSSSSFVGPGDQRPKAKRCPKGKKRVMRKGKARCVKRHRKGAKRQRQANQNRRAGR